MSNAFDDLMRDPEVSEQVRMMVARALVTNSFDDLMSDPTITDRVKDRILYMKASRRMPDNDDLLFVLAHFGMLHKLWVDAPEKVLLAAEAISARLQKEIEKKVADECVKIRIASDSAYNAIAGATNALEKKVSEHVIKAFDKAEGNRLKVNLMHTNSVGVILVGLALVAVTWAHDLYLHVREFDIYTKAKDTVYWEPLSYMYNIPVGDIFVAALIWLALVQLCRFSLKFTNWKINEWIDKLNSRGGL